MENQQTILFSNDTSVEKVLFLDREPKKPSSSKSSKGAQLGLYVFLALMLVGVVYFAARDIKIAGILILVMLIVSVIFGLTTSKKTKEEPPQSVHPLGEHINWHYDFYEEYFTAKSDGNEDRINYSDITNIGDTGAAYQIKAQNNYTLKKAGFNNGDEQRFVDIMRDKTNAALFLRDVQR